MKCSNKLELFESFEAQKQDDLAVELHGGQAWRGKVGGVGGGRHWGEGGHSNYPDKWHLGRDDSYNQLVVVHIVQAS